MSRILVVGATSNFGWFVARELKERRDWVRDLTHNPDKLRVPGPVLEPAVDRFVDDVFMAR